MKKVFFAFAVVAGLAMTACNNKPAEGDAPKADTTVTTTTTEVTPPVDTTAKPADTTAAAPATTTETKTEEKK
ncbi:MAG: hypothetical protein JSS76_05015 [Bacteroidetes bacterium]|nr:hypothetical protein [Bacteroidota bacterium]MBS1684090.1 hypothetical protein [Bacteroidota bacterium]